MTDQTAEGVAPADENLSLETEAQDSQPAATAADDVAGEDAPGAAEDEQGEQPKPKSKTAQERIADLTRRNHEERRAREDLERRLAEAQRTREAAPAAQRPDPSDYADGHLDAQYVEDLVAYQAQEVAKSMVEAERQRQQDDAVSRDLANQQRTWEERKAKAAQKFPDYAEVVDASVAADEWPCPPPMAQAIYTSEVGPELAYHLATNPDEAIRIAALPSVAQVREIGRLEAKLEANPIKPKTASTAPTPPASQVRGAGGQFKVNPATDDFAAFDKAYS